MKAFQHIQEGFSASSLLKVIVQSDCSGFCSASFMDRPAGALESAPCVAASLLFVIK